VLLVQTAYGLLIALDNDLRSLLLSTGNRPAAAAFGGSTSGIATA
jgi:hypothetical protein